MTSTCIDLTGLRFSRLIVICRDTELIYKDVHWNCLCDCGNKFSVGGYLLRNCKTKSCGCYRQDTAKNLKLTHGLKGSRTWNTWMNMIQRCCNPNNTAWLRYGGRGISVCSEWRLFVNFRNDMGDVPTDMSLERIDVNGDYCKYNCCWATPKQQARNRRSSKLLSHDGLNLTIAEWSERLGISQSVIGSRIGNGWSVDRALTEPLNLPWSKTRLRKST